MSNLSGVTTSRKLTDRCVTVLVWAAFAIAMLPLVLLLWEVLSNGITAWSGEFFSSDMRTFLGEGGGVVHAIVGTLIITAIATVVSVPIGVLAAVYLVEYGQGNRLSRVITFLVDVMTGIPSIVAGLFAYAVFEIFLDPGVRMGVAGAVALSVLMLPIVIRATEEMLKLVPDELREASYALGVPKWRTVIKVVLPTAMAGIITGVTLAVARVAGETAPLLVTVGFTTSMNWSPVDGRMQTLPVFIFYAITEPGQYSDQLAELAWGAALLLITIVMTLNVLARLIGSAFAPKTGR